MKNKNVIGVTFSAFIFLLIPGFALAGETLTMDTSIDIALKNSFTVNSAQEGVKAATAQKREAITGFLPRFNTSYSYTRLNEAPFFNFPGVTMALPSPPLPPGSSISMPPSKMIAGTIDNYNWSIEARQPLFTGGGLIANYQASRIGEDAALMEETAKKQDVVQEVKIAYFDILRAQKILQTAKQSVEMLTAHRDVAQNYFQVGMIPKNDLLNSEVQLANGKQALVKAQNAVEMAKSRFNTVLKRKIYEPVEITDDLKYQPFEKQLDDCFTTALKSRPEMKIAALRAAQAGKLVRVAQSEYLPTLSIVGNYTRFGDNPSVAGSDFKDAENWYVMGVASWNFWEWGKTKFRVDASKARENQALYAARELNDQIALEIKNAYLVLQETEKQIGVSQQVIEQAEENFRISEERYKERVATTTEVLDAQTLLTRAKSDYANALGDFNISYAKLQRAMGVIWP
jgi:outer membrane protein TolC